MSHPEAPDAPQIIESERLVIQPLGAGTAPLLQHVFEAGRDAFPAMTGTPELAPDAALREVASANATPGRRIALLTLRESGEPVGALGWWEQNPDAETALVGLLLIVPEARCQGLAREALAALEEELRARGATKVRTAIRTTNLAAHPVLKALGFELLSIRDHAKHGLGISGTLLWEKPIA
jgi:RimJ/RimL family protein N-acetyltransferase